MSKMKDFWGDTIEVFTDEERVCIYFSERIFSPPKEANMELDADRARKLIKKLKNAIAEVEEA